VACFDGAAVHYSCYSKPGPPTGLRRQQTTTEGALQKDPTLDANELIGYENAVSNARRPYLRQEQEGCWGGEFVNMVGDRNA
jgi:hypothetical protein